MQLPVLQSDWVSFGEAPAPLDVPVGASDASVVLRGCCALCLQPIVHGGDARSPEELTEEFQPRVNGVDSGGETYLAICANLWFSVAV